MCVTSRSGVSAAYFSTENSPHALPTIWTLLMSRSPACASAVPSAFLVSPKTPTILCWRPRSARAAAVPVKATILVGVLSAFSSFGWSSVKDHGPAAAGEAGEDVASSLPPHALSTAPATAAPPAASRPRRDRGREERDMLTSFAGLWTGHSAV